MVTTYIGIPWLVGLGSEVLAGVGEHDALCGEAVWHLQVTTRDLPSCTIDNSSSMSSCGSADGTARLCTGTGCWTASIVIVGCYGTRSCAGALETMSDHACESVQSRIWCQPSASKTA